MSDIRWERMIQQLVQGISESNELIIFVRAGKNAKKNRRSLLTILPHLVKFLVAETAP
jgi:hypothetical protein